MLSSGIMSASAGQSGMPRGTMGSAGTMGGGMAHRASAILRAFSNRGRPLMCSDYTPRAIRRRTRTKPSVPSLACGEHRQHAARAILPGACCGDQDRHLRPGAEQPSRLRGLRSRVGDRASTPGSSFASNPLEERASPQRDEAELVCGIARGRAATVSPPPTTDRTRPPIRLAAEPPTNRALGAVRLAWPAHRAPE